MTTEIRLSAGVALLGTGTPEVHRVHIVAALISGHAIFKRQSH
jgi:hypothetical protein